MPNLYVTPGYLLTSYFYIPIHKMKRTSVLVLDLGGLVGLRELFNFSFFGITGWGIDLDYCDVEWFALEMN